MHNWFKRLQEAISRYYAPTPSSTTEEIIPEVTLEEVIPEEAVSTSPYKPIPGTYRNSSGYSESIQGPKKTHPWFYESVYTESGPVVREIVGYPEQMKRDTTVYVHGQPYSTPYSYGVNEPMDRRSWQEIHNMLDEEKYKRISSGRSN